MNIQIKFLQLYKYFRVQYSFLNISQDQDDEFDDMLKGKKTLKEKLGTPEEVIKKGRKKKGDGGDGLKQTKLNFSKGKCLPCFFPYAIKSLLYSKNEFT